MVAFLIRHWVLNDNKFFSLLLVFFSAVASAYYFRCSTREYLLWSKYTLSFFISRNSDNPFSMRRLSFSSLDNMQVKLRYNSMNRERGRVELMFCTSFLEMTSEGYDVCATLTPLLLLLTGADFMNYHRLGCRAQVARASPADLYSLCHRTS